MRRVALGVLVALLVVLVFVARGRKGSVDVIVKRSTRAMPVAAATASVPFPFGVADPAAFALVRTDAGIDAIALDHGDTIWRAPLDGDPIALVGSAAVVLELDAHLTVLSIADGSVRARSERLPVPDWVGSGSSSNLEVKVIAKDGFLYVRWNAETVWDHPYGPPPDARRRDAGCARCDFGALSTWTPAQPLPEMDEAPGGIDPFAGRRFTVEGDPSRSRKEGSISVEARNVVARSSDGRVLWTHPVPTVRRGPPRP